MFWQLRKTTCIGFLMKQEVIHIILWLINQWPNQLSRKNPLQLTSHEMNQQTLKFKDLDSIRPTGMDSHTNLLGTDNRIRLEKIRYANLTDHAIICLWKINRKAKAAWENPEFHFLVLIQQALGHRHTIHPRDLTAGRTNTVWWGLFKTCCFWMITIHCLSSASTGISRY